MNEPLQAISNVIELKPGHKYLLVLKGDAFSRYEGERATALLKEMGIESLAVMISDDQDVQVIEAPDEASKAQQAQAEHSA